MKIKDNTAGAAHVSLRGLCPVSALLLCLSGALFAPPALAVVPTIITVNSSADAVANDGNCTLREAIIAANTQTQTDACLAGTGDTTIVFDPSTDGHTITLTDTGAGENAAATGDLDVTSGTLVIQGNGASKTIIDGNGTDRVFQVLNANTSLTLTGLTITNGGAVGQGGGIWATVGTSLSLSSVTVTANVTNGMGGGIEADGDFSLSDSTVSDNSAGASGGNTAYGGGVYLSGSGTTADIAGSTISGNVAVSGTGPAAGGGINSTAQLALTDSVVTGNSALSSGGGVQGGGISIGNGTLALTRVELSDNTAQSSNGGVALGGGLATTFPTTIINSTIAGNFAGSQVSMGEGGGLWFSSAGAVNVVSYGATIAKNSATDGGGIYVDGAGANFLFVNTIIADNTLTSPLGVGADCNDDGGTGAVNSQSLNLIGVVDGCTSLTPFPGDHYGTAAAPLDPKLGTLQVLGTNGTRALPLLPGSPAIDAGDPNTTGSGGTCYSPDQVGNTRPKDDNGDGTAACDIGAVEYVQQPSSSGGGGGGGALGPVGLLALFGVALLAVPLRRRRSVA